MSFFQVVPQKSHDMILKWATFPQTLLHSNPCTGWLIGILVAYYKNYKSYISGSYNPECTATYTCFFPTLQDESRNNKRFGSLPGYPPIKTTPNRNKGLNLVATQIFFIFTPKFGEDFQFDEHIFQMGWNHQPDRVLLRISFPTDK